jgi:hypothetical protein
MARTPRERRWLVIVLLAIVAAGFGCNPILAPFYLLGVFNKPTFPPEYAFYEKARTDKDKRNIKVLVLANRGPGVPTDFTGSEVLLGTMFAGKLTAGFAENKEKVTLVPISEVERFKQDNENWKAMDPRDIGKKFKADYVIDMELLSLSLYASKSHKQFYQGQIRVSLSVIDVEKPDLDAGWRTEYTRQFPASGPQAIDSDMSQERFMQQFFVRVATDLSWKLTAHPTAEHHAND